MKKALKIILWLFGTFVVLAIVAAVVVPLFLDPTTSGPRSTSRRAAISRSRGISNSR